MNDEERDYSDENPLELRAAMPRDEDEDWPEVLTETMKTAAGCRASADGVVRAIHTLNIGDTP